MNWYDWLIVGWLGLGVGGAAWLQGQPRRPLTRVDVLTTFIVNTALAVGLALTR